MKFLMLFQIRKQKIKLNELRIFRHVIDVNPNSIHKQKMRLRIAPFMKHKISFIAIIL